MLLIWDIHLNSRIKDKLLNSLKSFIQEHNEEKNLIFLWDFVYHFSYDRNVLLELYDLFLELYTQWKNIYILAWNHDWLWNTFVFEEWRKAFDMLSKIKNEGNEICFITKPLVKNIEWRNVCFLPSILEINEKDFEWIDEIKDEKYTELVKSKNKNVKFSAQLNLIVKWFMKNYDNLILVHHYYIEWISFPWQSAKFDFKDRALSHDILDKKNLQIISWHLHQAFAYKNYLCVWSVWATSPLEFNQIKHIFLFKNWKFEAWEIWINYYFMMERKKTSTNLFIQDFQPISESDMLSHRTELQKKDFDNLNQDLLTVEINYNNKLDLKNIVLSLVVDKLDYDNMSEVLDLKLQKSVWSIQLKKNINSTDSLIEKLEKPDLKKQMNFWNWIDLLKNFIKKQYPEEYEEYEKLLHEIKLL